MKILIIGKVWPEPDSSAAGKRMLQLINLLKKIGEVHFFSTASKSGFETDLNELSILEKQIELNSDSFDEDIKTLNPQLVVFDRFMTEEQFGWRVIENCPDAMRILNTEDLHFLRKARGEALKRQRENERENESENKRESEIDFDNNDTMRELAAIYRCDLSLLVSPFEIELLLETFQIPSHLLYYLPIFSGEVVRNLPDFESRKDLVFIGNFLHEPNVDAVNYLHREIWPIVRAKRKDIKMHIFGAYPTQQIKALSDEKSNFIVHGRTLDAKEVTKHARLAIAPLRFGAGIKGKLLEAMECGTPSVTTSIGAEGMAQESEWPGAICNSASEFSDAILTLYDSEYLWCQHQEKGFDILKTRFNRFNYDADFLTYIQTQCTRLENHRTQSFTQKIFIHQSMMSTKYLSKWIMEKNLKK